MGYKHLFGHGTRKDCGRAADYYGTVAQLSTPRPPPPPPQRVSVRWLLHRGIYSHCSRHAWVLVWGCIHTFLSVAEEVAASGLRYGTETHRLVNNDDAVSYTEEEDVVQYWKYSAETGDPSAQVLLHFGQLAVDSLQYLRSASWRR